MTESIRRQRAAEAETYASEEELKAIFERTYGPVKKERGSFEKRVRRSSYDSVSAYRPIKKEMPQEQYLLVDGYNIIFSWEDLNESCTGVEVGTGAEREAEGNGIIGEDANVGTSLATSSGTSID